MKKTVFFISLFCFVSYILIGQVEAISSNLKDNYAPKETIIGELSGSILSQIKNEQMKILRLGHIEVPFEGGIQQINGRYYFWFVTPQNSGNYSLKISGIQTVVSGNPTVIDYKKDFIVSGELIDYSIKPGFIYTSKDFKIIANLYKDEAETISVNFPTEREIILEPGTNQVYFSTREVRGYQFLTISFGNYLIPAFIMGNTSIEQGNNETNITINQTANENNWTLNQTNMNNQTENITVTNQTVINQTGNLSAQNITQINTTEEDVDFNFTIQRIRGTALRGGDARYSFGIINNGKRAINNLALDYDATKFDLYPGENLTIEPNRTIIFNLTVKNTNLSYLREAIFASAGEESKFILISIKFTGNSSEIETTYLGVGGRKSYCSELPSGLTCSAGETCKGETATTFEGVGKCCLGKCEKEGGGGSSWIGYLLAAIIVIVLVFVYLKYRKTGNVKNPLQRRVSEVEKKVP